MPRYLVTLDAPDDSDGPPPAVRLRRWLKLGLRNFGLRCLDIRQLDDTGVTHPRNPNVPSPATSTAPTPIVVATERSR